MDDIKLVEARKLHGRLIGLRRSLSENQGIHHILVEDMNSIAKKFGSVLEEDFSDFLIPETARWSKSDFNPSIVISKIDQLGSYVESGYGLGDKIIEVGSLVNAIRDEELRARCLDLLSAPSKFDRVVNQATQVLEDRIRTRSGVTGLEGTKLVNEVIKAKKDESLLVLDNDEATHEGLGHVLRGIMLSYRNGSHHGFNDVMTRDDALKICGFVDVLIQVIDGARKR